MLKTVDVKKRYGRKQVLDGISQEFPVGLTLLVGPSGAGKSTLLRLLATAEKPSSGVIEWYDEPLPKARKALRQALGYAPQAVDLPPDLTAREFAMHMAALKGINQSQADEQFLKICKDIGLHADVNDRISTFSGGMRRRLVFAQSLLGNPELVALDEPTAELDVETAGKVNGLILEAAKTKIIVMTTHLTDDVAPHATTVLRIEAGKATPA